MSRSLVPSSGVEEYSDLLICIMVSCHALLLVILFDGICTPKMYLLCPKKWLFLLFKIRLKIWNGKNPRKNTCSIGWTSLPTEVCWTMEIGLQDRCRCKAFHTM